MLTVFPATGNGTAPPGGQAAEVAAAGEQEAPAVAAAPRRGRPRRDKSKAVPVDDAPVKVETRGRKPRSGSKRGPRKKTREEDQSEDGEFEAPRSVRYPRGVSIKALKRARKQQLLLEQQLEEGRDQSYARGRPPIPGGRPRRTASIKPFAGEESALSLESCERILETLEKESGVEPFLEPVDCVEYDDYLKIVQWPMDLSTIRQRLDAVLHPAEREKQQKDHLSGEEADAKQDPTEPAE